MKPAVRYIAIFVAVLLFALRPGAKAQPIVAHGYEFTFGTDSTRWIDIDGVGTFENRYSYPQTVQLPFDFTMYNRTFSTISVYYNGDVLKKELYSLTAQLDELQEKLRPQTEEAERLKDVRMYVRKLLPELEPDGEALTPERRQEKIEAIQQRLAKAKAESEANAAAYAKSKRTD